MNIFCYTNKNGFNLIRFQILSNFDNFILMNSPLNYSRVSKADSEALRSTGASLVFKTVGRNVKPTWTNRITKDVNDLSYNININFFGKNRFKSTTLQKNHLKKSPQKSVSSARQKRKSFFSQELNKIIKTARTIDHDLSKKIETNNAPKSRAKRNIGRQSYGLSPYEFKNTIKGKLDTKPNIHLMFDNQVSRKEQAKQMWYNTQLEIDVAKLDAKKYRRILEKCHPFQSYTERRVFQTKDKVDKIYEIENAKRKTSPNRIKRTVPLQTIPGRKQQQIKQSSYLSYEIEQAERAVSPNSPKYTILKTPKSFSFTRQVIDQKRGCYR